MKIHHFFMLIVLLSVFSCTNSTIKSSKIDFAIKDTSLVDSVLIKGADTLILSKNLGTWFVNNTYKADNQKVNALLNSMKLLDLNSTIPKNGVDLISKQIKNDVLVEIFSKNKIIKSYYIGKYIEGSGNYLMLADAEIPYIVHIPSYDFDLRKNFTTDIKQWKSLILFNFKINQIKNIYVKDNINNSEFYLSNNIDNFELSLRPNSSIITDANQDKIENYLSRYKNVKFEKFFYNVEQTTIDSLLNETPIFEINIKNNTNKQINFKAYYFKNNNDISKDKFIGLADNKDLLLAKFYDFDILIKDYSYFLN